MNRFAIRLAALLFGLMAVSSCSDDRYLMSGEFGDGEADIAVTASFKSYDEALAESRSDGNILDGIDNLTVLVYDSQGETLLREESYKKGDEGFEPVKDNTNRPADGDKYPEGVEDQYVPTDKVTFNFPGLSYGRYKIYVVANASLEGKDYSTVENLKQIKYEWDTENIGNNKQMFGWFSTDNHSDLNAWNLDAPTVVINQPRIEINAWLVRLASKVTVAYDASKLNKGVYIFLKSVEIKDIPKYCALGVKNTPGETDPLIPTGGRINYYTGEAEPTIAEFDPKTYEATLYNTDDEEDNNKEHEKYGSDHAHKSNALFFYENCQGKGKDKRQDAVDNSTTAQTPGGEFNPGSGNPDEEIDFPDGNNSDKNTGFKDEKRCGTYIEVKAYYKYDGADRPKEQGEIVYRFMLGQDALKDYDAYRNYHYKLTLEFKGYANDVDWHIDYIRDPGIVAPNPYFISYLYDKSAIIPVEIAGELDPTKKLEAEIIENGWWPVTYDEETGEIKDAPNSDFYYQAKDTEKVWNGFLSLRNTAGVVNIGADVDDVASANAVNKAYWEEKERGERTYEITPGTYGTAQDGEYEVTIDKAKKVTIFNIPYYTRAKNLVKKSGFTGNNPYVSYQRRAKVRFTAYIKNHQGEYEEFTKVVDIIQVRRIVNPKGIWRAHNEIAPFKVHLMRLETEYTRDPWNSTNEFQSFKSIGPWSAEVIAEGEYSDGVHSNTSWIILTPENGVSEAESNKKITGKDKTSIQFNYQPSGTITKDKVRYGIIKVRYHNYTCEHLIFVRQGYAPIPVVDKANATVWHTFNLVTGSEMASSPCDEGSLFKRFALDQPIRAINNITYPFQEQIIFKNNDRFSTDNKLLTVDYKLPGNDTYYGVRYWNGWGAPADKTEFDVITLENGTETLEKGTEMKVATVNDYLELYNDEDVMYGFGILYDGSSEGVQEPVKDAYSYYAPYKSSAKYDEVNTPIKFDESKDAEGQGRGMRGCFVYNQKTGAQIFLPIGAAGYGRRRQQVPNENNNLYIDGSTPGLLIYGNRNTYISNAENLPLLYDLFQRPGACYWTNETQPGLVLGNKGTENSAGWDFNYVTFDFFPIAKSNITAYESKSNGKYVNNTQPATDALRIRCVVPSTSKPVTN